MSSNIKVTRHCEYCGSIFVAKTTFTRYCSSQCNKRHYKLKQREEKIEKSDKETHTQTFEAIATSLGNDEIFTVKEAARFLKASTRAIYDMIGSGRLRATKLSPRNTRIKRVDIESVFNSEPPEEIPKLRDSAVLPKAPKNIADTNYVLNREDCFSVPELITLFDATRDLLYHLMKKNQVPKIKIGKDAFFSKVAVQKVYKQFQKPRVLGLEKERKANERVSNVPLERKDCYSVKRCEELLKKDRTTLYSFFKRRNIPKLRIGQEAFYAKSGVDKIVRSLKGKEEL